jgi:hypothetical protein
MSKEDFVNTSVVGYEDFISLPQQDPEDLLEVAWGIIANAGFGDWTKESNDWQAAANRWRGEYFAHLKQLSSAL